MSAFCMMAGTVMSSLGLVELQRMICEQGIECRIEGDELCLDGAARINFRPAFDHEYLLVGEAPDEADLTADCRRLSSLLQFHGLQHAYELYARDNALIGEFEFIP